MEEKPHDIDLMMIVDDTRGAIPDSVMNSLRADIDSLTEKLMREKMHVHFQPPKPLSLWWDMLRSGNPLAFTSMRDAQVVYDPAGYIEPIQILLRKGRLAGTREQARELIARAPLRIEQAKRVFLEDITADIMAAMTESANALLMFTGVFPGGSVHRELREKFVAPRLLEEKFVQDYENFFDLARKVQHGEVTKLSGEELDKWLKKAAAFVERMEKLFNVLDLMKRKSIVEEAHRTAFEAAKDAIRNLGAIPPEKHESIIALFKSQFVDTGLVSIDHLNLLHRLHGAKQAMASGRWAEIPEREVYESQVYAKNLAMILEQTVRKLKGGEKREQEREERAEAEREKDGAKEKEKRAGEGRERGEREKEILA